METPPSQSKFVVWFTGLPSAGKTTLARALLDKLRARRVAAELLDGDEMRALIGNNDFSSSERNRHIRYVGWTASLLAKNGTVTVVSLVSPHADAREFARTLAQRCVQVWLSTPLAVCEARDVKGLYKKARAGEIKDFTGVSAPYENPTHPDIVIDTSTESIDQSVDRIWAHLQEQGLLDD